MHLALLLLPAMLAGADEKAEFFETRVRPVLAKNCYLCHLNPPAADLRLDSRSNVLKGGKSGPAAVPGDAAGSLLIQTIRQTHAKIKMPPGVPLTTAEVDAIAQWVNDGMIWPEGKQAAIPAFHITPQQRAFWAFQPPRAVAPPVSPWPDWKTPVDRFLAAKLREKGLRPAAVADRRTLIRRATFDLTGLPPTPEEVEAFIRDNATGAFQRLVDRLLASRHYGERWGRHWLDLVRYADTVGDTADFPVPQAHLYRDWVIDALNRDLPYDQFLREQIAGDLMSGGTDAERWRRSIATGYLAIARRFGFAIEKWMHLTIDDVVDNMGKSMLGLTISCARCHDHKYDPISSRDYYALFGFFGSTRFPYPGCESSKTPKDFLARTSAAESETMLKPYQERLAKFDEQIKDLTAKKKTAELAEARRQRLMAALQMPVLDQAYAVAEGIPQDAPVLRRGEPTDPGPAVERRFLEVLGGQKLPTTEKGSGRLQLAEWIASGKNPLTARVMVNRIWQHHFGRGLVATPNDFGTRGKAPSHPELLDYLAVKFMESGWSIKAMHRTLMLTHAYQMASENAAGSAGDPDNDYLWKFRRRRLDAESLRDAMLAISGDLDLSPGGAHPFPHPAAWDYSQHRPFLASYETKKRSVYMMAQRIQRHPFFALFDGADPNASTAERSSSTTPLQALFALNAPMVQEAAQAFARRVNGDVALAFQLALGRPPDAGERKESERVIAQAGMAPFLQVLLTSNEFVYVD